MSGIRRTRTVAIDPTGKGFAFSVLEGSERLIDWGLARVWSNSDHEWLARVAEVFDRSDPRLLVLEKTLDCRRSPRARRLLEKLRSQALDRHVAIVSTTRQHVLSAFGGVTNKWDLAVEVAKWFPELTPRLPRKRQRWQNEDQRVRIFEATARALVVLHDLEQEAA